MEISNASKYLQTFLGKIRIRSKEDIYRSPHVLSEDKNKHYSICLKFLSSDIRSDLKKRYSRFLKSVEQTSV